jgi:hypothetical protein
MIFSLFAILLLTRAILLGILFLKSEVCPKEYAAQKGGIFYDHTPTFIQIRPKTAKLMFL